MKRNYTTFCALLAFAFFTLFATACSKDSNPGPGNPPDEKFDKKYFQISILAKVLKDDHYDIKYEIKNTAGKNYDGSDNYYVKLSVTATDGTIYTSDRYISDLGAGVTRLENPYIYFPTGKPINTSSFKYEIIEKP